MTAAKFLAVIGSYRERFERERVAKIDFSHEGGPGSVADVLAHCHGMLDKMVEFVKEEKM